MKYDKPWLNFDEQLNKLIERGLVINNYEKAKEKLQSIGYYRLSGYWFSFRKRSGEVCLIKQKSKKVRVETLALDEFKKGSTFQKVLDLYVFDKKLRLLTLDALERIEISLRAEIAHRLGEKDKFAYLEPKLLHSTFTKVSNSTGLSLHHEWLSNHARLINRSKENFVKHNKDKYGLPLAVWVACEVWDFGCLSKLYAGLVEKDQDLIAERYGVSNGRVFASWLRSLNYLRNVCAHHSRLWNRNIIDQPKTSGTQSTSWEDNVQDKSRCFYTLLVTQHLLSYINPTSTWGERIETLILEEFPNLDKVGLGLQSMGMPENWQDVWLEAKNSSKEKPLSSN